MTATSNAQGHDPMPDILLVEDNALHVRLVKSMLADVWPEPNRVRVARKLSAAIEELGSARPDCILLDLLLPDADGLQAVQSLLAIDSSVPIVVLSSHEDDSLALQAVREGAQDYLVKGSVDADGLARAVRFSIQRQRMDRAQRPASPVPDVSSAEQATAAVLDGDGAILGVQVEVAEMLGLDPDGVVGAAIGQLAHPNDLPRWQQAVDSVASGGKPEFSIRLRHASGNDLRVRVELSPLFGASGPASVLIARLYPIPTEGTQSSGGQYAVVSEWAAG